MHKYSLNLYKYSILFCSKNHGFSETRQTGTL
nr:MAG TPA: hypothetical protein [Bacteriophage sp.]